MTTFDDALLAVGRAYQEAVRQRGGRSLARVATIVADQGAFFDRLARGSTCTARNLQKFCAFFSEAANWPDGIVPDEAIAALASMGRPVLAAA